MNNKLSQVKHKHKYIGKYFNHYKSLQLWIRVITMGLQWIHFVPTPIRGFRAMNQTTKSWNEVNYCCIHRCDVHT
jgi:hypothetical protein